MKGKEYFKQRLSDIYEFSLIDYLSGEGSLQLENSDIHVKWELCVDVSGQMLLIISCNKSLQTSQGTKFNRFNINGTSYDEDWKIECEDVILYSKSYRWNGSNELYTYFGSPDLINLYIKKFQGKVDRVKAYISNFNFIGLEFSDYEDGSNLDKFDCKIQTKTFTFRLLQASKKLIELIQVARIPNAVLSTVSVPILAYEDFENSLKELNSLCWFISFLSLNTCFSPMTEMFFNDKLVQIRLDKRIALPFCRESLIDNLKIDAGIIIFLEQYYEKYLELERNLDFNTVVSQLLELQNIFHIEVKFATLIMAYEYLLSRFLVDKGITEEKMLNYNIQQKLGKANKYLKFIPANSGDYLRDSIRNPLFHQGSLPFLSLTDKLQEFDTYYELLIKIILKVLGYQGKYISRINYHVVDLSQ